MPFDGVVENDTPILGPVGLSGNTEASIVTWPWPMLILTKYHLFSLTKHADGLLYLSECAIEYGHVILKTMGTLGSAITIDSVSIADFGSFYVVATIGLSTDTVPVQVVRTYVRDMNATGFPYIIPFTVPTIGVVCNYNGQLVGGNIVNSSNGLWSDLTTDGLLWSGIGNFNLDPSSEFTAGFMKGSFPNASSSVPIIYKLLPLDSRYMPGIVVYSDAGRFLMTPNQTQTGFAYGVKDLDGFGITSGNHVAGDSFIHGFIDVHRDFWTIESPHFSAPVGGNYKKLGYRSHIKELFDYTSTEDHRVIVSYVSKNKRFYISNGNKCLIINEFGACHVFQSVSSVVKATDGRLYGTFKSNPDISALLFTDGMDFGSRGLKTIEAIVGGIDATKSSIVQYTVEHRSTRSNEFGRLPWRNVSPRGEAHIGVTSGEFKLGVRISNYLDAQVEWLAVNVKFPDNRFKRGPSLAETNLISTRNEV